MISEQELTVFPDLKTLCNAAAGFVTDFAKKAIEARGQFTLVLTGGPEPPELYKSLASPPWRDQIEWDRCQFFVGDERVTPHSDPDNNFAMAEQFLLSRVPVSASQLHRVPTELGTPEVVASRYEQDIRSFFGSSGTDWPRFDLVLLGLGSDGHTASLFPGMPTLEETERLIVASPPGVLPPPIDRVTFTFPLINAARAIVFLVAGAEKAPALRAVREGIPLGDVEVVPAALVRPSDGELRWFVDSASAG